VPDINTLTYLLTIGLWWYHYDVFRSDVGRPVAASVKVSHSSTEKVLPNSDTRKYRQIAVSLEPYHEQMIMK